MYPQVLWLRGSSCNAGGMSPHASASNASIALLPLPMISPRNQKPCSQAPEADLSRKKFNWCPVTPIFQSFMTPAIAGVVKDYGLINPVLSSWMASDRVEMAHDPERSGPSCG